MNFYESSNFGLRVTVYELKSNLIGNIKIRLVPMVHIGEEQYYKNIESKLIKSDLILYEGIHMKSKGLRNENRKVLANRLGLVTQTKFNLKQFKNKLVHADYDAKTAIKQWKNLSLIDRLKIDYFFPIYMYFQDRTLTRKKFVKYFMKSNEDIEITEGPIFDEKESIKNYIHYKRDNIIFKQLEIIIDENRLETMLISIVYGAGHMKSIFRFLSDKYGYRAISGEFVDVFKT